MKGIGEGEEFKSFGPEFRI